LKTSIRITITSVLFVFLIAISINGALAQTFQPPQIPAYDLPNRQNGDITIPNEPANPGAPKGLPDVTPTPLPTQQTDYMPIAIVIIIVVLVAIGLLVWRISQKGKTMQSPPPN
jgi:hypothetical protein